MMPPIRRILVPIDFSDASKQALNYGLHLAEAFAAEIRLLHVVASGFTGPAGLRMPAPSDQEREQIDREMAALIPKAYRDLACELRTASGEIEEKILEAVRESSADLVVMGSHGRRRFERWLLGSVTEHILRRVPVPVLTVSRIEESTEPPLGVPLRFERILCPTDFSDSREVSLPVAAELARRFGAVLEVAHVVEHLRRSPTSPPYTDQQLAQERRTLAAWAGTRLDDALTEAKITGVEVRKTVLEGGPSQALLAHIEATHPDLVVMTLHGMSFLERALLGATAERIVRASTAPVLSIPRLRSG